MNFSIIGNLTYLIFMYFGALCYLTNDSEYLVIALDPANSTGSPSSTSVDQDAPSPSTSQTPQETQPLVIRSSVEEEFHDIEVAHLDNDPLFGVLIPEQNSKESSSTDVRKWTKDHPLDNVIENPS
ncbi:hypothetical protein Tco_0926734 [Tanacetum coccineum]|uniref:Uncharacterized protein n=1 Tax=Tanacetum coccineum TaxID=301880 RepID=A0ABQ5DAP3_9ASTR